MLIPLPVLQSPFRRDVLCNVEIQISREDKKICFNSLFVGMCFAISAVYCPAVDCCCVVSIPFSSGCALQLEVEAPKILGYLSFNSLFVGMSFAIVSPGFVQVHEERFQFPFRRDVLCNQYERALWRYIFPSFNSLFVGMSFAICPVPCSRLDPEGVSIPFSSG